jgi:tRNA pseudouridine55 synthase
MDGLLLLDKPQGPTSHDIVARLRSVTRERRVGHTGTLDPAASGLLPLVFGKATRLASLVIRLGVTTDTDDVEGEVLASSEDLPADDAIDRALARFTGTFEQVPPRHSAKKIEGEKAYDLARRDVPVTLPPVEVTVRSMTRIPADPGTVRLQLTVSSGFYVRALARDLGRELGCGAHLESLRRTAVGRFTVENAVSMADAEREGPALERRLLAPADAVSHMPAVTLNEAGLRRAVHGNSLSPEHLSRHLAAGAVRTPALPVAVLAPDGSLVALAHSRGGVLHPAVVLG